jgi:hypothetical protein
MTDMRKCLAGETLLGNWRDIEIGEAVFCHGREMYRNMVATIQ